MTDLAKTILQRMRQWSTGELGPRWYPFVEIIRPLQWDNVPSHDNCMAAINELTRAGNLETTSTHTRYKKG